MHPDISLILFDEFVIQKRIQEIGRAISQATEGKNPILVCILRGAVVFLADLIRVISVPLEIDFMSLSSYGNSTVSSGVVNIRNDITISVQNRHLIIIEDIIDSGLTLKFLVEYLVNKKPKSIQTCVLLDKKEARTTDIVLDYVGFEIPNEFVVGYGLDFGEKYRNLPYIGILKKEVYI